MEKVRCEDCGTTYLFVVHELDASRGAYDFHGLRAEPWNFSDFRVGGCADTVARLKPGETTVVNGRTFTNAGEVPGVGLVGMEGSRLIVFRAGEAVREAGLTAFWAIGGDNFAALWAAGQEFAPLRQWCEEVIGSQEDPDAQVINALNQGRDVEPVLARLERLHVLYGCPLPGHWERLDSAGIRLPKYIPGKERLPRKKTWVLNNSEVYTSGNFEARFRLEAGTWKRCHWAEVQWR